MKLEIIKFPCPANDFQTYMVSPENTTKYVK